MFNNHSSTHSPYTPYIGRFAPSPTGPLHFGSLVSALASYLDAHHQQGKWLVRMEDLDPPREQPGAASAILQSLDDHGLHWDGDVAYQSQRLNIYQAYLLQLQAAGLIYACNCTRQDLAGMGGIYNGRCRTRNIDLRQPHALRLKLYDLPASPTQTDTLAFCDLIQGPQQQNLRTEAGDQILKRKDGLFAYQLAVVVDDIEQQISHIIRGSDLLDVTARQIFLYQLLNATPPQFGHVTLVTHSSGQKLSKQNFAPPLDSSIAAQNLWHALAFLRQEPPQDLLGAQPQELLQWGKNHWKLTNIHGLGASI
ncbi:MAG TPA: tRNA glutamyl-Q(34) synthetase GluQRS [Cellvibrio sp.]|nr:tRNA glutamyl-Q(34) synthetase GluQRS [Cellvibrio sp.]